MKIFWLVGGFAMAVLIGAQFGRPGSLVRQPAPKASVLIGAGADAHVTSIIERSCANCHSLKTDWPLYSRIFPFSSMIENDVQTARTHMNLSRWQIYDDSEKRLLLSEIGSVVRNHVMPPRRYTIFHPGARLSQAEANDIYQWTRADRIRLHHSPED